MEKWHIIGTCEKTQKGKMGNRKKDRDKEEKKDDDRRKKKMAKDGCGKEKTQMTGTDKAKDGDREEEDDQR